MFRHPLQPTVAGAVVAAALALAVVPAAARPPGTNCPDSTERAGSLPAPAFTQLSPGSNLPIPSTDAGTNADLVGATRKHLTLTATWVSDTGSITAGFEQWVTNKSGDPNVCVLQNQVHKVSGPGRKICAIVITNFLYSPTDPLYAASRTDSLPSGAVPGDKVKRSAGQGRTIRIKLDRCIGTGEYSEVQALVFESQHVLRDGQVRLEASDGSLSDPLQVWNPRIWP